MSPSLLMKTSFVASSTGAAGDGGRAGGLRPRGALVGRCVRFNDVDVLLAIDDDNGRGVGERDRLAFFFSSASLIGLSSSESSSGTC